MEEFDPEVQKIARAIEAIHGSVVLRYEAKGLHIYFASPAALEEDGEAELYKRDATLNVDCYLCGT